MKIIGLAAVDLSSISFSELRGAERRCTECQRPFDEDESVVVFGESVYRNDAIPVKEEDLYFLHVQRKEGGSCLEDYISRFLQNKFPPPQPPSITPTQ